MPTGAITVTDGKGNIILAGNIWVLLLSRVVGGKWGLDPEKIRVFLDGKEVVKPESMGNGTQGG